MLKTKVNGKVKLVRAHNYIIVTMPGGEDMTIYGYDPDKKVYKVGDKFDKTCYIKKIELSGRFKPVPTLRLYLNR